MKGLERQYLRECIKALVRAREALLSLECERAILRANYGKYDTLALDAAPEAALIRALCEDFDPHLLFVTEETGDDVVLRGSEDEVVCFSDPMDRSKVLAHFLSTRTGRLREALAPDIVKSDWERENGGNIELTGAYGSITAVRHHHILFNVMINYITGRLYIACDAAIGTIGIEEAFDDGEKSRLKRTDDLIQSVSAITFTKPRSWMERDAWRFVTFCKGNLYEDNLVASDVSQLRDVTEIKGRLVYDEPGGPARILYLTEGEAGFILANGEKIGEWIGWLAWVAHSDGALRAYEISFDSSWTRDEILMAPGQAYTILGDDIKRVRGKKSKAVQVNLMKLGFLRNPSQYRSTLLVCPASNEKIRDTLYQERCTELKFEPDGASSQPI